jgi:anti-sigma factor RsiW
MTSHPREDRLHDYAEDLLCREERAEVEHHLLRCESCRTTVKRLRDRAGGTAPREDLASG